MSATPSTEVGPVAIDAKALPVYCPNPAMPLWSSHPRVYLVLDDRGETMCPYCGTRYKLTGAARPQH